jgi:hypothetical protein
MPTAKDDDAMVVALESFGDAVTGMPVRVGTRFRQSSATVQANPHLFADASLTDGELLELRSQYLARVAEAAQALATESS